MAFKRNRLYVIWINMKGRCFNQSRPDYKYYGGRGITVCDEWKNSFQDFKSWAMSSGYNDNLTIDRIDVDGDYCQENCRWIPFSDQRENTRQTRKITINRETKTIKSWCRQYGISYDMVMMRIHRGMDDVSALLTPKRKENKMNRLTMWYDGNHAICENEKCSSGDCPFADPICEQVQNIIDRLTAYEDTGLEPEEIIELKARMEELEK